MCGIIAIVRRVDDRLPATPAEVAGRIDAAVALLAVEQVGVAELRGAAAELLAADELLGGLRGLRTMLGSGGALDFLAAAAATARDAVAAVERGLGSLGDALPPAEVESVNAALIELKDAAWSVERDRLRAARGVTLLGGDELPVRAAAGYLSLHQALSAIDRLEVRGRDSAGIEVIVTGHGLDLDDPSVLAQLDERANPLFTTGSVRRRGDALVFVYKAAAEIGELGDNTAVLRAAIAEDALLGAALRGTAAEALVVGHTRWASIGIISEPNAHPQVSDEPSRPEAPLVTAVLNGDVDNFADLIVAEDLEVHHLVTTDAKVIPTMVSRRVTAGDDPGLAFRETVAALEGSVAIAAHTVDGGHPGRLHLALRGSGQALYVGVADDCYIVASEPYGVIEETSRYLRLDGETPANPDSPTTSRGQIVQLDASGAGTVAGIRRWSYDGIELPIAEAELATAQITTRDIDRRDFPHFLLKEISDAPDSFRKTLRGKLALHDGVASVSLPDSTLPAPLRAGLRDGSISRVLVIGQGTAAVAGQSLAHLLADLVADSAVVVEALPATELSGFRMRADMSDTLVVAISQSGTTTDTNRTVDLVRDRGARVVAIVNRRGSDLTDKSDGVLYTSDGRDVEMSVASTKAFYSQIAAGLLLAVEIAGEVPGAAPEDSAEVQRLLADLGDLPGHLETVLATREEIAAAARQFAPPKRYWALVGNGSNQIAARELRIKLSELCYKSIACDATEDKKHIDLSSEPLIIVCAAGLVGSTADDVAKEIAIFRAHKATPVVIASEGASFPAAMHVIRVPVTHPALAFVLSAMAGHLFGYEAALAIDAQAHPLREARAVIEAHVASDVSGAGETLLASVRGDLAGPASAFLDGMRTGAYDGHLEASTAVRLAGVLRFAMGTSALDGYQSEFGKVGTPGVVLEDLTSALTAAVEELTRPIDAIKHQAKTVTVGISRSDESLLQVPLVVGTLAAGAPRDRLAYSTLRALADLDPAIEEITGYTRYAIEGAGLDTATAVVVDRGGVAAGLPSRTERDPRLRGTKHLVAREMELMVAKGRSDGRNVLIVPETKDGRADGLTLLHIRVADRLPAATLRGVLQGYRRRYQSLRDAVTETEDVFREDLLAEQPVIDLLCEPIYDLADRWRT